MQAIIGRLRRVGGGAAWALAGYVALAALLWGRFVAGSFGSDIIAGNDFVPSAFLWLIAWWPHALLHGMDPVLSDRVLAPVGVNLSWVTSVPALSLAFAPVTLLLGPVVTWNLLALLAPALSAWTAFLLCRHLTHRAWPSALAGCIFGFSPYMAGALEGLPHLSFVALVPLVVLLVVRHADGTLGDRAFIGLTAVALAAEFAISTEVFATFALLGGVVLLGALALAGDRRAALRRTVAGLALAAVGAMVLVSPLLFCALFRQHVTPEYAAHGRGTDLAGWVIPDARLTALAPGGHGYARGLGYVGVPLLAIVLAFAVERGRDRTGRVALLAFAVAAVASLGSTLSLAARATGVPLPWGLVDGLPALTYAIPGRLSMFVALAAAVIVALWLTAGGRWRWAAAGAALVALMPNVLGATVWRTHLRDPSFFTTDLHRRELTADDRVLVIPTVYRSLRWQADAGFSFRMAGGGFANSPPEYSSQPIWRGLAFGTTTADEGDALYRFVHDLRVTAIVVDQRYPGPWRALLGTLGVARAAVGGVWVYRLGARARAAPAGPPVADAGVFRLDRGGLAGPGGAPYRVVPGAPAGMLEAAAARGSSFRLIGWAGRARGGLPARTVALFSGERFAGSVRVGGRRPDVTSAYPALRRPGWSLLVPLRTLQVRGERPPLRAYALDDRHRAMALTVSCGPAQAFRPC